MRHLVANLCIKLNYFSSSFRINRESRGRLSLSSSSSDDSRISDPEEDVNKSKQNIVNKVNNVRSPTVLPSGGGGPKTGMYF